MKPVTVGITTRNRPAALARALLSLRCAADVIAEAIVFDDASDPAVDAARDTRAVAVPTRVIRDDSAPGYIVGRNRLVEAASTPFVLLMDDDAALLSREATQAAVDVLQGDPSAAAVAFAQANADGTPWASSMQPALCARPALVRSFIGFAHLLRRDVFRQIGGYQELFGFHGEEKELCIRLIDRGHHVVYLPDALVIHSPDPASRDSRRYLRHVTRNDCLTSIINDPWPRTLWIVPARLALYFRMRRSWQIRDPGGFGWILRELGRTLPTALHRRRPVSRGTLRRWRELGREGQPYTPGAGVA